MQVITIDHNHDTTIEHLAYLLRWDVRMQAKYEFYIMHCMQNFKSNGLVLFSKPTDMASHNSACQNDSGQRLCFFPLKMERREAMRGPFQRYQLHGY